jgi:DNA-binding CsgD family transcriptional regulator
VALERDLDEAEQYFQRARRIAEDNQLHHWRTQVLVRLGGHQVLANGDERTLDLARSEAQRTGAIALTCAVDSVRTLHAIMRGEFGAASEILDQNMAVLARLQFTALSQYAHMTRAMSAAHQGNRRDMELALDDFHRAGGESAQEMVLCIGLGRVFCSLLEENPDRAGRELAEVVALEQENPSRFHLAGQHGLRVLLDVLADRDGSSEQQRFALSAVSKMRWNRQFVGLAQAVLLGRQGHVEAANKAATAALDASALYPLARHLGLRLIAEAAAADGWGDPVTWLKSAEEYFHQASVPAVASACRGLLRKIGAPVGQRREGLDRVPNKLRAAGVTVREYEVLQLLADRIGNKDIAGRLHISPRTVEKHVGALMAKLSQPDRAALTEYVTLLRKDT